ncbi:uncharacterized protein TRIVIDRAFT_201010 [Trichoderma virens Gv29-8]|uniref:Uncharacterized protein n=1 Tax=Hypocrea virens (strain Gv29-8 / FGSC 10586) TaxID=413071 RepID=G9MRK2_HYPVG|nr:uncharacterized protein TRIVIDRAFT_201010 [Trichoderma virens Gv29-8]EHK22723.1 hypothetical protein TRIVIDRAFT_201010 [Trichoderma virens Gv29-8]UKZ47774.1 hypothetical protein TrVGV298_002002 [Trichoderma virens]
MEAHTQQFGRQRCETERSLHEITEYFWHKESDVNASLHYVDSVFDREVECRRPDWTTTCYMLERVYNYREKMIEQLTNLVVAWCIAMEELANDKSNSQWKDAIEHKMRERIVLTLRKPKDIPLPSITFSDSTNGFDLHIPITKMRSDAKIYVPMFKAMLLLAFTRNDGCLVISYLVTSRTGGSTRAPPQDIHQEEKETENKKEKGKEK